MKTAISIPDKVFNAAEELAAQLHMSRSALYAAAVSAYIARHTGDLITSRLDAVYRTADGRPTASQPRISRADHW